MTLFIAILTFPFFHFHFLSSLRTTYQQQRGKPRISRLLYTQNGLQRLRSYSFGCDHANLLSGLQYSSVLFFLLVNALKNFRAIMVFVLCWISCLSKTSGYRAVSSGVNLKEPIARRVQLLYSLLL